jgi:hypothetical protein
MSPQCERTGAVIFLAPYATFIRGDAFPIGEEHILFRVNNRSTHNDAPVHHYHVYEVDRWFDEGAETGTIITDNYVYHGYEGTGPSPSRPCSEERNMTDQLKELLERVEKATGPDREIDVWLLALLGDKESPWGIGDIEYALTDPELTCDPPTYTVSLDACLALVERVLPGHCIGLRHDAVWGGDHRWAGLPHWQAEVTDAGAADDYYPFEPHDHVDPNEASHCTPALALLAALLRAKIEAAP